MTNAQAEALLNDQQVLGNIQNALLSAQANGGRIHLAASILNGLISGPLFQEYKREAIQMILKSSGKLNTPGIAAVQNGQLKQEITITPKEGLAIKSAAYTMLANDSLQIADQLIANNQLQEPGSRLGYPLTISEEDQENTHANDKQAQGTPSSS